MAVCCATCFRRGWQVKQVLPWNLLTMLPYRDVVRYDLVLFGRDEEDTKDVLEFVRLKLSWATTTNLLRVATAPMEFWSCPEANNTAHVFAATCLEDGGEATKTKLLVNTDRTAYVELTAVSTNVIHYPLCPYY